MLEEFHDYTQEAALIINTLLALKDPQAKNVWLTNYLMARDSGRDHHRDVRIFQYLTEEDQGRFSTAREKVREELESEENASVGSVSHQRGLTFTERVDRSENNFQDPVHVENDGFAQVGGTGEGVEFSSSIHHPTGERFGSTPAEQRMGSDTGSGLQTASESDPASGQN